MKRTHDRSWSTHDRGPPAEGPQILTIAQIGPKRKLMRNGMLLCEDVPIARAGWMLYGRGEVPIEPDPTSPSIYVKRTTDELFDPETIGSLMGCAVTDGHPSAYQYPQGVTPDNFRELAGGFSTTNIRPGKDGDEDVLLADLIISRRDLIEAVMGGKREISVGYDADYVTVRPGIGQQSNIRANHIALVEKGRCGPRCAIGDHDSTSQPQEHHMPAPKGAQRRKLDPDTLKNIEALLSGGDNDGDDDEGASHVHVHVHNNSGATTATTADADTKKKEDDPIEQRFAKIESGLEAISNAVTTMGNALKSLASGKHATADAAAGEETPEQKAAAAAQALADAEAARVKTAATQDSAALATSYQDVAAKCEILVPGFRMPTFDAAATRATTVDSMCGQRRLALTAFGSTADGASIVASITGDEKANLADLDCKEVAILFNAAAAAKGKANNAAATHDSRQVPVVHVTPHSMSVADIDAANRKYWASVNGGTQAH